MTTAVEVSYVHSYLLPDIVHRDSIVEGVDDVLSWYKPGHERSTLYQNFLLREANPECAIEGGVWDGKVHLLTPNCRFPSGLLHRVQKKLWSQGVDFELRDLREYPEQGHKVIRLDNVEPRDYQEKGVEVGLRERHGLFDLPPATGKTEMLILLVHALGVYPTLWLTHATELLKQTQERFEKRLDGTGISVGKIGSGTWDPKDITIATVQSMASRVKSGQGISFLKSVKVVISDEAHHAAVGIWYKLLQRCPAPFRFGCSATPLMRTDQADMRLIGILGKIIYQVTPAQAVKFGVLSVPSITFHDYEPEGETDDELSFQPWVYVYQGGIVDNEARNRCVTKYAKLAVEEGRKVLILIRIIRHGEILEEMLKDWFECSDHIRFLRGASNRQQRSEAVEAFKDGVVRVVIASSIFDEGVDIPQIDSVIIVAAGKAAIKAWQRVGRGMRKSASSFKLEIHDFVDRRHRYLLTHSRAREKAYRSMDLCKVRTVKETS